MIEAYIIDQKTLEIKDIIPTNTYQLNLDEETNAKSQVEFYRKPEEISKGQYVVLKGENLFFQGIIVEVSNTKQEEKFTLTLQDISNIFNRKVLERDSEQMLENGLENYIANIIKEEFVNENDFLLGNSALNPIAETTTLIKEPINSENGVFNFHTFLTNCRQHQNISIRYEIEKERLNLIIRNNNIPNVVRPSEKLKPSNKLKPLSSEDTATISIDTTIADVIYYTKIYEIDALAKLTIKAKDTGNVFNYFLKSDRTITTDANDANRVEGRIDCLVIEKEEDAYQTALNQFKGNRYNHLVEFSIKQDSKIINVNSLTIGRTILLKTKDDVYESYISAKTVNSSNRNPVFKSGNIRIDLIGKLRKENF